MKGIQFSVILVLVLCLATNIFCGYLPSRIIIVEDAKACFRRALAGKRVTRSLIRRALPCGRVDDCQQECQDEKRFVCEGFNYRLDPTGRGNGDCELLDLPMVRLDMVRDIYPDPGYDIYEKDRNGYPDCKGFGNGYRDRERDRNPYADRRYDSDRPYDGAGRPEPRPHSRPNDHYHRYEDRYEDNRRPGGQGGQGGPGGYLPIHGNGGNRRIDDGGRGGYRGGNGGGGGRGGSGGGYGDDGHRRHGSGGDGDYRGQYDYGDYNSHREPEPPYPPKRPLPYLPDRQNNMEREKNHWGIQDTNSWGTYGGSYGTGSHHARPQSPGIASPYDVPAGDTYAPKPSFDLLPKKPNYLPGNNVDNSGVYGNAYGGSYGGVSYGSTRPTFGIVIPINSNSFGEPKPTYATSGYGHPGYDYTPNIPITENHYPPTNGDSVEHKDNNDIPQHTGYNFLKEECSLRTATGFRLHKIIVKKYYSVPDIYECETLCFKEKDFQCHSYAYRYTLTSSVPTDNCYLSNKNYKALDFYTDLEPDRDFDIYTMNNRKKCEEQIPREKEHSDCFWHTRSGQRLDQKVVREATMVKSIVECQIACLRATKYLCRGFSFRYGSATIGGPVENCLLTDWPFKEVDPNTQFASELGFEIYERGSFGHGCEPNHFAVRGKDQPIIGSKTDQLCYVGYGTPARLLPEAIRKSSIVNSELDCKLECTKFRHSSLFQCMSFSYRTKTQRGESNCDLSDILQRDLLSSVDYVADRDSWLFAWDNYNPECVALTSNNQHNNDYGHSSSGGSGGGGGGGGGYGHHGHQSPGSHSQNHYGGNGFHDGGSKSHQGGHGLIPHPGGHPGRPEHDYAHARDDSYDMSRYGGPMTALDTWRVYSVSGWPCRRGSLCRENKEAGFWYCDLEGGDRDTWDYCCRPDHQCGYSEGYNYQWCYVGPEKTQWRKCSERYYPYTSSQTNRNSISDKPYLPTYNPSNYNAPPPYAEGFIPSNVPPRPAFRPNRPLQRPRLPPNMPSLNEYEKEFSVQFLDPPKPGGFGQPRLWPVSYLHRELPPDADNATEYKFDRMKDGRLTAIHNLISIINSNNLKDIKYEINNQTNLLIQVPLPGNFTQDAKTNVTATSGTKNSTKSTTSNKNKTKMRTKANLEEQQMDTDNTTKSETETSPQAESESTQSAKNNVIARHIQPQMVSVAVSTANSNKPRSRQLSQQELFSSGLDNEELHPLTVPTYRKSYIVRTNKTDRALHF